MQVVICGLGKEGHSSYRFWRQQSDQLPIILVDDQPLEKLDVNWKTILLHDQSAGFVQTENFNTPLDHQTLIMVSPGIKPDHPVLKKTSYAGAWASSNTQIFLEICLPERAQAHPLSNLLPKLSFTPKIIGVTGTKGKSTTTAIIYHVLEGAGWPCYLGGNIGQPALDLLDLLQKTPSNQPPIVVLELSCHQLNRLTISPQVAVIQTITPEHLDYYPDFDSYALAKSHICTHQLPTDNVIYHADNPTATKLAKLSAGSLFPFSLDQSSTAAHVRNHKLFLDQTALINTDELRLIGQHNWLNVMPSAIIAHQLGVKPLTINHQLRSFSPLPHRLELFSDQKGVEYYNDSLSTTPEAAIAALNSFDHPNIILIAGGYDRGLDYSQLAKKIVKKKLKLAILLPDTGNKIAQALQDLGNQITPVELAQNLAQAVVIAQNQAQTGDVVLLSPGSASFNQFKDYQDRGNTFKKLVLKALY